MKQKWLNRVMKFVRCLDFSYMGICENSLLASSLPWHLTAERGWCQLWEEGGFPEGLLYWARGFKLTHIWTVPFYLGMTTFSNTPGGIGIRLPWRCLLRIPCVTVPLAFTFLQSGSGTFLGPGCTPGRVWHLAWGRLRKSPLRVPRPEKRQEIVWWPHPDQVLAWPQRPLPRGCMSSSIADRPNRFCCSSLTTRLCGCSLFPLMVGWCWPVPRPLMARVDDHAKDINTVYKV